MHVCFDSGFDKITVSLYDFAKATKSSFYKIIAVRLDFVNSTVKPNTHVEILAFYAYCETPIKLAFMYNRECVSFLSKKW